MDGINGITGGYSAGVLFGMYLVNRDLGILNPDLFLYLFISILVFGYFNFRKKARFFAGDIGSISIAVILFFMMSCIIITHTAPVFILWMAVYGVDGCLTIAYRKKIGEKIMQPHRLHIYQKIVDTYKTPHLIVAFSYAILQFCLGWLVYKTYTHPLLAQLVIVGIVVVLLITLYLFLFYKIKDKELKNRN
jgi:uncharacterized membrane protein